uniref:Putative chaperonin n=1 Tax=viral metagenome TaxID=1070528 RepID=A0A6M3Y4F9_9ZZZZ
MDKLKDILRSFDLMGNSLILKDLDPEKKEKATESGIILTQAKSESIELHKAEVVKAGKGYINDKGLFIKNPIDEGAIVYYKSSSNYELEGIEFKGTEIGQVVAYKNKYQGNGQRND